MSRYLASIWYARGKVPYSREKIAPTGSAVAVLVLGDPIIQTPNCGEGIPYRSRRGLLVGPHDRPVINEPAGETHAVGIVATAVGCEPIFGVKPAQIRGRVVDLESVWSPAVKLRRHLLSMQKPEDLLNVLEQTLAEACLGPVKGMDRCEQAVSMLEDDPTRPIHEIAAALNISHGHLNREFTRIVGLSPRVLARLLRVNRLLRRLDVYGTPEWADFASLLGWFDQAHLIRDFKHHTGVTPSQYVSSQRHAFSQNQVDQARGFAPET